MPDFSVRTWLPEKMDQPDVDAGEIRQALRELEIINKFLGGYHVIKDALEKIKWDNHTMTIVDLGCGGGDLLCAIADWAEKSERKVKLIGIDWNPVMTEFARERAANYRNIEFNTMSVHDDHLLNLNADIAMSSLFCHHFDNAELVKLIRRMNQIASRAVIINDIHRHWMAYHSIHLITALFSKTYLVKYDAPLSVARSLTRREWKNILFTAGINEYRLSWMWAWRWQLIFPTQ